MKMRREGYDGVCSWCLLACVTSVVTYTQYGVYRVVIVHIMAIVDQFELLCVCVCCVIWDGLFHV